MKRLVLAATAACVLATGFAAVNADARPRHVVVHHRTTVSWRDHSDWHNGGYVSRNDWNRGRQVDYRSHHLRRPPSGYEWRQVDNNYVLVAVASGLIASIIASHN